MTSLDARTQIAAMAMAGVIPTLEWDGDFERYSIGCAGYEWAAKEALKFADALIAEAERTARPVCEHKNKEDLDLKISKACGILEGAKHWCPDCARILK